MIGIPKTDIPELNEIASVVLSEKTARYLNEAGLGNINNLRTMTDEDILSIKGIGPARLEEIKSALNN